MSLNTMESVENPEKVETQSQVSGNESQHKIVWGRLHGKNININSLDLNVEEFYVGRGRDNDLILTFKELAENTLKGVSKVHFIIKRANCDLESPVYIQDLSQNGTFVNKERIGPNKLLILKDDDVISLCQPNHNTFVFKNVSPYESMGLPEEITKAYSLDRTLGTGGFGVVRLAYDTRTGQEFAMKIVKRNMAKPRCKQQALKEINIMKDLSHPCVIRMHHVIDRPEVVYMVLEYMPGGDLLSRLSSKRALSEETSKLYFYQMCHAVKYLHDRGIIHRDLKPGNFLLQTNDEETLLKVCDFGLSCFVQEDSPYTRKVDIWSLGVVLFCCLSGTFPFFEEDGYPLVDQVKNADYGFRAAIWDEVSQDAKLVIEEIFIVNPIERPSIDDVLQFIWLKDASMTQKAKKLMKLESME